MNRSLLYVAALSIIFLINSCTDDFTELNTDPKNLTVDNLSQSEYGAVVKAAMYAPAYLPSTAPNDARGAFQLTQSLFSDIYGGYFATTAPNFDSDKFILVGGWLNGAFNYFYGNAAPQIKYAEDFAAENGYELENAMMKVWRVWSYHRITDYWGPIPYSEFGNGERSVPYDSQEDIYRDFFTTLDEAVPVLVSNAGETSFLGANDLIYGGNIDKWLKFANTLRLRLAMRVKYVSLELSRTEAEKAASVGEFISSNDDRAIITTSAPFFTNPYNTITQWGEFRMSADMESILKGYEDPRVSAFVAPADEPDPSDDPAGVEFPYEGMRNGQSRLEKQSNNFNALASNMAEPFTLAGVAGPNYVVMNAAESYFLRAEGALEGWNMGGTAQVFYEEGIITSHEEYGLDGSNLAGNPYVESPNTPASYNGEVPAPSEAPVAYNAGGTKEQQLEQIITQKWIAIYPNSQEAWAEKRRTGYPVFYDRLNTDNAAIPVNTVPRRVPFVDGEFTTNAEAVNAAIDNLLGGPNNGTTKLWWDAKP
ncbi:SusD/RagB family nutrient-binding outer membrane lipoprotein [Catalinimonas niigatensis]|uniref:SusD/RagB family nutrient-binding outer membrane lipoprotein n=1 Tax=Catalinimonas niigatensis TaxID=1397264 RepID=UPI00266621C1|nr:SusD/RagB family nutrient-binding outer membrane lipoprotein [Catalinimonas niigatensis]WPP48626.1 SusD/RagB family nutrient-binding outer membrane lipoprotein [Catalinimonas niigatensis]